MLDILDVLLVSFLIYCIVGHIQKRLHIRLDILQEDIHRIANELREERRSKDYLYKFVMDNVNKREEE